MVDFFVWSRKVHCFYAKLFYIKIFMLWSRIFQWRNTYTYKPRRRRKIFSVEWKHNFLFLFQKLFFSWKNYRLIINGCTPLHGKFPVVRTNLLYEKWIILKHEKSCFQDKTLGERLTLEHEKICFGTFKHGFFYRWIGKLIFVRLSFES